MILEALTLSRWSAVSIRRPGQWTKTWEARLRDSIQKIGPRIEYPVQIDLSHQQLWQTKLESRCHRSRQKPWKLLRNQKEPGRHRRAIGRLPVTVLGQGTSARERVPRLARIVSASGHKLGQRCFKTSPRPPLSCPCASPFRRLSISFLHSSNAVAPPLACGAHNFASPPEPLWWPCRTRLRPQNCWSDFISIDSAKGIEAFIFTVDWISFVLLSQSRWVRTRCG